MQFINYFLASVISYLGIALGIILIYISPEEQKPGIKYFSALRYFFFLLTILFLLFFNYTNIFLISLLIIFLIIFIVLNKKPKINELNKSLIIYLILAVIFYLSYENINLFVIESTLIFLYGTASASLLFNRKNYLEILFKHVLFIIVALILFLLF